jgi:DtxR family Mn-dependent transcriptional regulator
VRGRNEELKEEILEIVWVAGEEGRTVDEEGVKSLLNRPEEHADDVIGLLMKEGKILRSDSGDLDLTSRGEARARKVIRRHRLAERLLNDVLEMDQDNIEGPACRFEHAISAEVEEKICTLLGHPDECPHGKTIPRGKCCSESQEMVSRAIVPLSEVESGQAVRVAYLTLNEEGRLDRLSSLGLLPGVTVTVDQKFPAFVVQLEETSVAMEKEVASNIFVRVGGRPDVSPGGEESDRGSFLEEVKKKFKRTTG